LCFYKDKFYGKAGCSTQCRYSAENKECKVWQFVFNNTVSKQEVIINGKSINLELFGMDIRILK
jgi:hypothetical protein